MVEWWGLLLLRLVLLMRWGRRDNNTGLVQGLPAAAAAACACGCSNRRKRKLRARPQLLLLLLMLLLLLLLMLLFLFLVQVTRDEGGGFLALPQGGRGLVFVMRDEGFHSFSSSS